MNDLLHTIAEGTYTLRTMSLPQAVLRLLTWASLVGAALLTQVWMPAGELGGWLVLALALAALLCVARPDSVIPTFTLGGVATWWFFGGGKAPWWGWVLVAMLLATFHIGTALAAAAPPWARNEQGVTRRGLLTVGVFLGLSLLAVGVVVGVLWLPRVPYGVLWAVAGAAALTGAAMWAFHDTAKK